MSGSHLFILLAPLPELYWHKLLCSHTVNLTQEHCQLKKLSIFLRALFLLVQFPDLLNTAATQGLR